MKIECVLTLLASAVGVVSANTLPPFSTNFIYTDELCYHVGEDIKVSFVDAFPHPQDWVAIYEGDADPQHLASKPLLWLYTCGDQHCASSASSGHLTFGNGPPDESSRAHFPLPAGHYKAILARNLHVPYEALAVSLVFTISDTSCDPATIIDVLEEKGNFHTLLLALHETGLDDTLRTTGPFTLFAPNDDAFALLGSATIDYLLANLAVLKDILLYHVVAGEVLSVDLTDGSLTTLNGDDIHVDLRSSGNIFVNGNIFINGNTLVVGRDYLASNGVVQEINKVLMPPSDPAPAPVPTPSPPSSVAVDNDCYHVGEDIIVSFVDGDPHPQDWVAIYEGDADPQHLASKPLLWLYTCGDQHCASSASSGHLTFGNGPPDESSRAHFPLPAGHYKAILARNLHVPYEALAVSQVFTISDTSCDPAPAITTDKDCYHVGEDINVSFLAGGDAHPRDFVAIYESTADTHNLGRTLLWLYSCGDQHCNFATESDTLTFGSGPPNEGSRKHFPLPAGHYKAILARGTHRPYEALAVSYVFSINTSTHPCS